MLDQAAIDRGLEFGTGVLIDSHVLLRGLKHDPEKWTPVFGKDHAQSTAKAKCRINPKSSRFS
jgi:hypothetical protein